MGGGEACNITSAGDWGGGGLSQPPPCRRPVAAPSADAPIVIDGIAGIVGIDCSDWAWSTSSRLPAPTCTAMLLLLLLLFLVLLILALARARLRAALMASRQRARARGGR